ncbi:MAG: ATP-binding protein [Myxococcota bacterium]
MLPLLERVVGHLERVQRVADKEVIGRDDRLDYDDFEGFVIELFERAADGDVQVAERLDRDHWVWTPDYLRAFVTELYWRLLDGAGARWTGPERISVIKVSLRHALRLDEGVLAERLTPPRMRLVAGLVQSTQESIGSSEDSWVEWAPWQIAEDYCERLGLSHVVGANTTVAPAGAIAIRLRGRDRLRWLLALETSLAISSRDPWCVDLGSVRILARQPNWRRESYGEQTPISDSTFGRWIDFGALDHVNEALDEVIGYELTPMGKELFGELDRNDATSFRTLARALLEDEREAVLAGNSIIDPAPDRATAVTLRHARMVAHEVRNALLPVQYALKKVWSTPAVAAAGLDDARRRIDDGLARLHRFVDDSLRLTPVTREQTANFSVMGAIDEARRECLPAPEGGISIEMIPASAAPECRGHRGRFVLVLLNLLRNAVQVGGQRISISVDARSADTVTIRVQDDGPGIAEDQRDTLFENGVSHRSEGSGHGLSFVRLVVEQEMEGAVRLVPSVERRGACFEIQLPAAKGAT